LEGQHSVTEHNMLSYSTYSYKCLRWN